VVTRVRRLTEEGGTKRRRRFGALVSVVIIALVGSLLVVLPATRSTVSAAAQIREAHGMCHLPHAGGDWAVHP
jgi:hypothetical protein